MDIKDERIIRLMKRLDKEVNAGHGRGSGQDYTALLRANRAKSIGTAYMTKDPIAMRTVHTLSTTEKELFYLLRWDEEIEEIREQYLMDMDKVSIIAKEYGIGPINKRLPYTIDFYVTYRDKTRTPTAYSVKSSEKVLQKGSREYRGYEKKYEKIMNRLMIEMIYWKAEDCEYKVVVSEDINHILSSNIEFLMSCYDRSRVVNTGHKLLYLIAHRYIEVPLDKERLMPNRLIYQMPFNVDFVYEKVIAAEDEQHGDYR